MSRRTKIFLILLAAAVFVVYVLVALTGRIPKGSVLVLRVAGGIEEQAPTDLLSAWKSEQVLVYHDYTEAVEAATTDPRIAGLLVEIGGLEIGWGRVQELRSRLLEFRKTGKPSVCYLSGDFSSNRQYYLASACEQVWLVPSSSLGVVGLMAEALFFRGTLDKLGVYPDMYHIGAYKTAKNQYTEKKFTPEHREMVESLIGSIYRQYVSDAAEARGMDRAQFEKLVTAGPFLAQEALSRKLIDRAAYRDEIQDFFKEKTGRWNPIELSRYRNQIRSAGGERIAVVYATGAILVGQSDYSPWLGFTMGSDSVAADLRRAREDDSIKAVILRVESPGGSAVGSEIIRREVQRLREKGKPIIVSMADVAGSGGYWISMSAEHIVAEPSTITASIGVVYGKMNISGLFHLVGLSTDYYATSPNATLLWPQQNFTPAQREVIQRFMQDIYQNFVKGVADGRKMKPEAVDKIGRGRVWTGAQAKDLGLVDELGGLDRAIAVAKQRAGIPAGRKVRLVRLPERKSFWDVLVNDGLVRLDSARLAGEFLRRLESSEPVQARMPVLVRVR